MAKRELNFQRKVFPINEQYGFVYISKNGLTSLISCGDSPLSYTAAELRLISIEAAKERGIKIFSVWRDPIDRIVSCWTSRRTHEYDFFRREADMSRFIGIIHNQFQNYIQTGSLPNRHICPQHLYYNVEDIDFAVDIHDLSRFQEMELGGSVVENKSYDTISVQERELIENDFKRYYKEDYIFHEQLKAKMW